MAKVAASLLAKLKKQVEGMRSGVIINNKAFTKSILRLLPCEGEVPGHEYLNLYFVTKKASSTSPRTFGLPCPVLDLLDTMRGDKSKKEDMEFARSIVNVQREYWIAVIERSDIGTPEHPRLRIHRSKRDVYQAIVNYMLDEDDGEDITNAHDGRDFRVKKTGSGTDTEWKITKIFDKTPIAEDEDMVEALVTAAKTFNVKGHFFDCKFDVVEEIYQSLSGEEVPAEYKAAWEAYTPGNAAAEDPDAGEAPEEASEEATEAVGESTAEEAAIAAKAEVEVGATITFKYTDEEDVTHDCTATVKALTETEGGEPAVDAVLEDGTEFTVGYASFEIVPEPEPEPEPEKPKVTKKGAVKKKAKATPKLKPGAKAKAGSPASKIRARLKAAKKKG
jgi:hypothetical protein